MFCVIMDNFASKLFGKILSITLQAKNLQDQHFRVANHHIVTRFLINMDIDLNTTASDEEKTIRRS